MGRLRGCLGCAVRMRRQAGSTRLNSYAGLGGGISVRTAALTSGCNHLADHMSRCSLEAACDAFGTHSAVMLLRTAFYGARRFDDLVQRAGVSLMIGAQRLKELVSADLLIKRLYYQSENRPIRIRADRVGSADTVRDRRADALWIRNRCCLPGTRSRLATAAVSYLQIRS